MRTPARRRRLVPAVLGLCLLGAAVVAPVASARADSARHPHLSTPRPVIDLPPGSRPEDVALGAGGSFYVGSLADGSVYRGDLETGRGGVLVPGVPGTLTAGVEVDAHQRLWTAGGPSGQLHVYDARTGRPLVSYQLADGDLVTANKTFVSDIVVTPSAAYVTDSFSAQLYVVPLPHGNLPDASTSPVRTVPLSGEIAYQDGFNANGIVVVDGTVVIGQTNTGKLFTVDTGTGDTHEIKIAGGDLTGNDGMVARGGRIYTALNFPQRIAVVDLDPGLETGQLTALVFDRRLDIPTSVITFGRHLYALNARFTTPVTPSTAYQLIRLPRL